MRNLEGIIRLSIQKSSNLPLNLWEDPRCQREANALIQLLLTPGMLELLAIHEAGHEIYYRRAGCDDLYFISPRITYNEKNENPFAQQKAAIKVGNWHQPEGDDWLLRLARGYAAGGRCSMRLTTTDYAGDTNDRENFKETYVSAYPGIVVDEKGMNEMWLQAQKDVNNDLNDESFQAQVRAKAGEIMPQLFPWLSV